GGQSLILTGSAASSLLSSTGGSGGSGAQIFLTICGDENSAGDEEEDEDEESQEFYAIKQEPGTELDVQALLPTNLQLPSGCEIYLVKDTSGLGPPHSQGIKIEATSEGLKSALASCKSSVPVPAPCPVPAPVAAALPAPPAAPATQATPAPVLYQRSQGEVASGQPVSKLEAYKKRDDKRRATHNEVERRRRDKINCWIFKLKEMLPSLSSSSSEASTSPSSSTSTSTSTSASTSTNNSATSKSTPSPSGRTPPNDSKSQILIKACEYIKSMQGEIDTLRDCLRETDGLRASNQALREELDRLKRQQQLQERFHTAASGRSTFNVTLNSLNSSVTSDLFEGIDTTPNLAAVSSTLGFSKRGGLLIGDYDG
ncbi:hypothetical protein KR018_011555, partial [Drosophila ironensis]